MITPSMACSCPSGSSIRVRTRHTASNGTTPASGIGWRGSGGAPSWSRRPSAWWTSVSPCSPASLETTGSATSYLCSPKTLRSRPPAWYRAIQSDDEDALRSAVAAEIEQILNKHELSDYLTLLLFDDADSI